MSTPKPPKQQSAPTPFPLAASTSKPITLTPEMHTHLSQVLEREQRYLDAQDQPPVRSKALGDNSFAAISPWLERTQWHIVYQNVRRDILRAMTQGCSSKFVSLVTGKPALLTEFEQDRDQPEHHYILVFNDSTASTVLGYNNYFLATLAVPNSGHYKIPTT